MMSAIACQGGAKFPRGDYGVQSTRPQEENYQAVHSSTGLWHHVRSPHPHRGQTPVNLVAGPFRPRLRKATAARGTSRGLYGGTSFGRLVFVPSDPLEQLNGALVMASPRKAEPMSCTVLELKPMGKLITLDKYLSVRLNQGLAQSSDSNL